MILGAPIKGRTAWVGLGNPDFGDDGAGLHLATLLAERLPSPHRVYLAGTTPERHVRELREERFDTVVLLDAVDFGAAPGSVAWFAAAEIAAFYPPVSTHKIPLPLVARLITEGTATRVWLFGLQPASLRPGNGLSAIVAASIERLAPLLRESLDEVRPRWPHSAEAPCH